MKRRTEKKQASRRRRQARTWMRKNYKSYDRGFDLAVDCAYTLDLCEWCEINGDKTFIPVWMIELADSIVP